MEYKKGSSKNNKLISLYDFYIMFFVGTAAFVCVWSQVGQITLIISGHSLQRIFEHIITQPNKRDGLFVTAPCTRDSLDIYFLDRKCQHFWIKENVNVSTTTIRCGENRFQL